LHKILHESTQNLFQTPDTVSIHRPWGVAYGIFLALAIIGGIYSITHRNPEYHKIDRAYMNNPHNCPLDGSNLLQKHHAEPGSGFNISDFMQHAGMTPSAVASFRCVSLCCNGRARL
jgi:hypothetical protein